MNMNATWRRARWLLTAVAIAWIGRPLAAQVSFACPWGTWSQWGFPTTSTGVASSPAHDTGFGVLAGSRAYFIQGNKLLAFRNVSDAGGAAGSLQRSWCEHDNCFTGSTLNNFPSPVPLKNGGQYIFLGAASGNLYKVNALTGPGTSFVDTRRFEGGTLVCGSAPGDALYATPAIVLYDYASSTPGSPGATFRSTYNDDLVIVFTANGCGDTTHNRIIAYRASNFAKLWEFNGDGARKVDRGTEGCFVDYANMRLFCGADLPDGATGQDSLFALDINTGALLWSANAGAILNRPTLNFANGRLYVANKAGSVQAYDLATGDALWGAALPVATPGAIVSRTPSVESRSGTWQNRILVLDSLGTLHAIRDDGTTGTLLWDLAPESGVQYRSLPVVLPGTTVSYAFVGRDDGTLQMIELATEAATARGVIIIESNSPGLDVYDPSIDYESGQPRLVVVSGNTVRRVLLPLCLTPPY